ncbi:MAG TPA: hypothetical protein ENJ91_04935 [Rhodobacteraceae bacterium]|nr:hypothetical protein [Paracoccaceae bacterium]
MPIEDYAYDGEGNRTASHLSNVYSANDHNQLLEDDDYTYAYDDKGNRISRTAKVGGVVETYSYDSQNRLVGYSSPTTTATYAYDALNRRIAKTVAMFSIAARFHVPICVGCTPYFFDNSAIVISSRMASSATRALNSGEWFFRFVILNRLSHKSIHLNNRSEILRPPLLICIRILWKTPTDGWIQLV